MTSFIPQFSTHDDEAKQDEEVHEDDNFDPKVQTLSHVESTDDEDSDDVTQDANVEGDMINEEETREGRFDHRLKTLETKFSEFKQTNQFAKIVSSIPEIVDAYLANKMKNQVKTGCCNWHIETESQREGSKPKRRLSQ
ncbi:hypothetical protein Tco_1219809 [Tanacetum coccineum]